MEKALNAMNTGHYIEAHKRFENVLMVEPSNFDALLGQILCVGGWSRISDIDPSDIIDEEDWNKIKSLFDDAKLRVSESDMEFFVKLEKLIFMLGKTFLRLRVFSRRILLLLPTLVSTQLPTVS